MSDDSEFANAIHECFSREGLYRNDEVENMVDAIKALSSSASKIADAVTPSGVIPSHDDAGGYVTSLTEAAMGMTAGLVKIADAIHDLAEAVRESKE